MKRAVSLFISLVLIISLVGCGKSPDDGKLSIPHSASVYEGDNYQEVIDGLTEAGFTNIETEVLDDLIFGWLTEDGEVESISVDGDTSYDADGRYSPDVPIVITYHTFSSEENTEPSTSPAETTAPDTTVSQATDLETTAPQSTTTAPETNATPPAEIVTPSTNTLRLSDIPAYSGSGTYIAINNNVPFFTEAEHITTAFENYSNLDSLGRCGVAYANICQEIMPTEERGSIGQVKPSGWQTVKYDIVDGKYLYNRCHLIGYQLSAENANTKNLITGTRYLNVDGMLPFENIVADYVKETDNHVLYRVTPMFDGDSLVATGVLIEAYSVEDDGDGICFNVFCYNIQPGVTIDYATGNSSLDGAVAETTSPPETVAPVTEPPTTTTEPEQTTGTTYILNTNTHKFHYPSCSSVGQMNESNKQEYTGSRDDLIAQGYDPCGRCNP